MEIPNRDQLLALYNQGPDAVIALIEMLYKTIDAHEKRIKHLEDILAKDSHNSSKPPSTDGFNKPKKKTKNLRQKSGKKPGGQPGHKGITLKQVAHPDHIISHHCKGSCHCGRELFGQPVTDSIKRQVFDIPPLKIVVTEHQADIVMCACGAIHIADFPSSVTNDVQYGENIKAFSTYLMNYQLLPYERTQELFDDLFGVSLSQGTLASINKRAGNLLYKTNDTIKKSLIVSDVVHFDESGFYINGERQWIHTAGTSQLTYYDFHRKRGQKAMDAIGILPVFKGRAIHDHLLSYFHYDCVHGLCNTHHLRELIFVEERYDQPWAHRLKEHLLAIKNAVENAKSHDKTKLPDYILKKFRSTYKRIVEQGLKANPPPPKSGKRGKTAQGKPRNLLKRLNDFANETLAFMYDFNVPFDNNLAERDIRMIKLQQKISGCFRSETGAINFCKIRSYISTVRKQGKNVLEALTKIFKINNSDICLLPK
jgi:transposase